MALSLLFFVSSNLAPTALPTCTPTCPSLPLFFLTFLHHPLARLQPLTTYNQPLPSSSPAIRDQPAVFLSPCSNLLHLQHTLQPMLAAHATLPINASNKQRKRVGLGWAKKKGKRAGSFHKKRRRVSNILEKKRGSQPREKERKKRREKERKWEKEEGKKKFVFFYFGLSILVIRLENIQVFIFFL